MAESEKCMLQRNEITPTAVVHCRIQLSDGWKIYQTTVLKYVLPRLALYVPPFLSVQNLDHIAQFDKVV